MRFSSIGAAALCALAIATASGCSFFGIDTREGIEYVTLKDRSTPSEAMYRERVAGTNLYKQWPVRYGLDYGYAPWDRKRAPQTVESSAKVETMASHDGAASARSDAPIDPTVAWQTRDENVRLASAESPNLRPSAGSANAQSPLKTTAPANNATSAAPIAMPTARASDGSASDYRLPSIYDHSEVEAQLLRGAPTTNSTSPAAPARVEATDQSTAPSGAKPSGGFDLINPLRVQTAR
jgi:hypothetical protein